MSLKKSNLISIGKSPFRIDNMKKAYPISMTQEEIDVMCGAGKAEITIIRAIRKRMKAASPAKKTSLEPSKKSKPIHIDKMQMMAVKRLGRLPKTLQEQKKHLFGTEEFPLRRRQVEKKSPIKKIKL